MKHSSAYASRVKEWEKEFTTSKNNRQATKLNLNSPQPTTTETKKMLSNRSSQSLLRMSDRPNHYASQVDIVSFVNSTQKPLRLNKNAIRNRSQLANENLRNSNRLSSSPSKVKIMPSRVDSQSSLVQEMIRVRSQLLTVASTEAEDAVELPKN